MAYNNLNTPQYKRLYELLRKHINNGIYKEGDLLPSENELCVTHNLTRPTIRQALQELVNDGYIKKQQGRGSVVNPLPKGEELKVFELTEEGTVALRKKEILGRDIIYIKDLPGRLTQKARFLYKNKLGGKKW